MGTLLSKGSTFEMNPAQMVNMAQANPAFRNQAANIVRSVNPQLAQQLQQGAGIDPNSKEYQPLLQKMAEAQDLAKQVGNNKLFTAGAYAAAKEAGAEGLDNFLSRYINNEGHIEGDNIMQDLATYGAGIAVVGTAGYEGNTAIKNRQKGKYIDKETGKEVRVGKEIPVFDENGNVEGYQKVTEDMLKNDDRFRRMRGNVSELAEKTWGGVTDGIKKVSDFALESMGAERLNNTVNSSTDSGNYNSTNKETQSGSEHSSSLKQSEQSFHESPPNKSNNIIPNSVENVKVPSEQVKLGTGSNASKVLSEMETPHMRHGSIHAKTVGGILGAGALIGDAIATGNLKPMVEAIKNWSDELMQGNLFDGGAITDVEDLVIGKTARNYAMDQFKKGNYAKGFAGVAAGMVEQAINGIAEIGETGIAGARAIFGDKSYSEYRKDNVISDINFFRPYEESISPKIQQDIATESVKQFGQFSQSNLQELQSSPQHALVNTLHGQHAITTNSGQLVIGGVPTGVSSVDYLNAMQNPQTAQAFSTILAQTDMSSFNPSQGNLGVSRYLKNTIKNLTILPIFAIKFA